MFKTNIVASLGERRLGISMLSARSRTEEQLLQRCPVPPHENVEREKAMIGRGTPAVARYRQHLYLTLLFALPLGMTMTAACSAGPKAGVHISQNVGARSGSSNLAGEDSGAGEDGSGGGEDGSGGVGEASGDDGSVDGTSGDDSSGDDGGGSSCDASPCDAPQACANPPLNLLDCDKIAANNKTVNSRANSLYLDPTTTHLGGVFSYYNQNSDQGETTGYKYGTIAAGLAVQGGKVINGSYSCPLTSCLPGSTKPQLNVGTALNLAGSVVNVVDTTYTVYKTWVATTTGVCNLRKEYFTSWVQATANKLGNTDCFLDTTHPCTPDCTSTECGSEPDIGNSDVLTLQLSPVPGSIPVENDILVTGQCDAWSTSMMYCGKNHTSGWCMITKCGSFTEDVYVSTADAWYIGQAYGVAETQACTDWAVAAQHQG